MNVTLDENEVSYLEYLIHDAIYGSDPKNDENDEQWETSDAATHVRVATGITQKLKGLPF